jgi:hypothetical protein
VSDVNSVPPIEPTPPVAPPAPPTAPPAPPVAPPAPPVAPPVPPVAPPGYYTPAAPPAPPAQYGPPTGQYGPSAGQYGAPAGQYAQGAPQYGSYTANQQYPYYAPPTPPQGLSIASMILGIGGVLFSFFYGLGLFPSIAAVITGHMARKRQPHARSMSLAGLITGYIGIGISVLWVVGIVIFAIFVASSANSYNDY